MVPQCLDMGADSNQYRAAERHLMDAIRAGVVCDFADGAEVTAESMSSWGPERTVRATLLRRLLTAENAEYRADGVQLRGAAVEGTLDLADMNVLKFDLEQCRIDTVEARRAVFTGDAWFGGATFTGDAEFRDATFTGDAEFTGATFTGDAWFGGATFTGDAWFEGATFTGDAWFPDATFTRHAQFTGTTFTGHALFTGAIFSGIAEFHVAIARAYDFSKAQFHASDPGPWVARRVRLTGTVFHVRARLTVATAETDCRRLQAREGVHLIVLGGPVDLEDAEFLRRSILTRRALRVRTGCSRTRQSWRTP